MFKVWLLATRPKTLTAAVVPVVVGTALAQAIHGRVRLDLSLLAFLSSVFIQIGTNFINDSIDFKKGADTSERLGPKRATQSGWMTAKQVWWGGLISFFIAAVLALPLLKAGGWPIFWIGAFSLLAGYGYTGGPFPLAYLGLGDLFVLIFFGWVAVSGIYYLNTGILDWAPITAGFQVGLLATVLIAINNYRDHITDRKVNKKTLPVRFGAEFAKGEIFALCFVPFLMGSIWIGQGLKWAAILPCLTFPLAFRLNHHVQTTAPGTIYNRFLAQGALLHLSFGILLSLGLWLHS